MAALRAWAGRGGAGRGGEMAAAVAAESGPRRVGFVGAGRMAEAIAQGLIQAGGARGVPGRRASGRPTPACVGGTGLPLRSSPAPRSPGQHGALRAGAPGWSWPAGVGQGGTRTLSLRSLLPLGARLEGMWWRGSAPAVRTSELRCAVSSQNKNIRRIWKIEHPSKK